MINVGKFVLVGAQIKTEFYYDQYKKLKVSHCSVSKQNILWMVSTTI